MRRRASGKNDETTSKVMMVRFLYLFLLIVFVLPSWGSVAKPQYDDYRYDGNRIIEDTQNYDGGAVQKLSNDRVRRTIWSLSDNAQGRSFFAFVDSFFVTKGRRPDFIVSRDGAGVPKLTYSR